MQAAFDYVSHAAAPWGGIPWGGRCVDWRGWWQQDDGSSDFVAGAMVEGAILRQPGDRSRNRF
jgi:hypothetical protein